jgi:LuxR family transcriptional regulator, maltose regulon positive regulatory protein
VRQAEGDLPTALRLLDDAERIFFADFSPVTVPIAALKARVWIAQGRLSHAWEWARTAQVSPEGDVDYVGQFGHATLARLLLSDGRVDEAVALTERLVTAAERAGWVAAALDASVVQALARHARGDSDGALESLRDAFDRAEPEGYVRLFVDEGPPMAALLTEAAKRQIGRTYVSRLQAAFGSIRPTRRDGLIEPLSDRELEVLRLLTTDLSGPEIANHLVVSLNTVRSHTKSIYAKLGVSSRRAAVRRAADLELLTGTRR